MTKPISQREARALRRRVQQLEHVLDQQRNVWASQWPRGVHIRTLSTDDVCRETVKIARLLGHAVVVTVNGDGRLNLYALPLSESFNAGGNPRERSAAK